MGLFGKSLEDKTQEAVEKLRAQFPGSSISASVNDKTVTLTGQVADLDTKTRVMSAFNGLVETDNVINQLRVANAPAGPSASTPGGTPLSPMPTAASAGTAAQTRTHDVVSGDTLSAIAKKYYGNANDYMKIYNANRDILNDPDKIKVGQKLKIPV